MWVGVVADSQTRSKSLKKTKSLRKSPFSTQISPFVLPNLTKNPAVCGWVNRFGRDLPKINNILNIPTRPCNDALELNSYKYRNRNVATEFPNTLAGDQQGV